MIVWSVSAFVFSRMRACWPSEAALATARISSTSRRRRLNGATRSLRNACGRPNPRHVVEEIGDVGRDLLVGREEAEAS